MSTQSIIAASRAKLDIKLNVIDGEIPNDIHGLVYAMSPSGTTNSNGLPYPEYYSSKEYNKEYGSHIMNGDGVVLCLDFNSSGNVSLKTDLMKTPCYYADEATGRNGALANKKKYWEYRFHNMGIARMSFGIGARNELNTAIVPFIKKGEKTARLLATYDVGRPFEFDPVTFKLTTPVGRNSDWVAATPAFMNGPFPLVEGTAHPSFDPNTNELFVTNYTRGMKNMLSSVHFFNSMRKYPDLIESDLEKHLEDHKDLNDDEFNEKLDLFYKNAHEKIHKHKSFFERAFDKMEHAMLEAFSKLTKVEEKVIPGNQVFLMKWDANTGETTKWKLIDENKKDLVIRQCMHQTGFTKDYIILMDSSFKFNMDGLISNPFPHNSKIDELIRDRTARPMAPRTDTFIVKRADLVAGNKEVVVKTLNPSLPLECIHFSANYENPDNVITFFTADNSANCVAEWLRPYDYLGIDKNQPIEKDLIGMFASGNMDVCRVGKFVVNAESGQIDDNKTEIISEEGNTSDMEKIGPHTWGQGLYTYRNLISPFKPVDEIKQIYWESFGLDHRMLTQFIKELYPESYPNRKVPAEEVVKLTKQNLPCVLCRQNMDTMKFEDSYQFKFDHNLRAIQFVPRLRENENPDIDLETDGYIVAYMVVNDTGKDGTDKKAYKSEIWIFDAAELSKGPICKMHNDEMIFAFPLHSAWIPEAKSPETDYNFNIREDYNQQLKKVLLPWRRRKMKKFMEKYVYQHFE